MPSNPPEQPPPHGSSLRSRLLSHIRAITRAPGDAGGQAQWPDEPGGGPHRPPATASRRTDFLRQRKNESDNREALLLSVLDSTSGGVMAFRSIRDKEGAITDFLIVLSNKAADEMTGRKFKSMIGKSLLELFPGNLSGGFFDRYVRVVETKVGDRFDIYYEHESVRGWFHITVEPWSDGCVVTLEEISQRKRAEQELEAGVAEMERFNRAMIGRENRVLEMKTEVNQLRARLGLPPAYKVDSLHDEP